jgi:putative peptide zinc metalloprotease protein
MSLEIMEYSLKKINENNSVRFLLLDNNEKNYNISEILYDILHCYKQQPNSEYIYQEINQKYVNDNVSATFIDNVLSNVFAKLNNPEKTEISEPINLKFTLVKEKQFQKLYQSLSFLHNKYIIFSMVLLSIISSFLFFKNLTSFSIFNIYSYQLFYFSIVNILIIYVSFLIIIFLHEIGHATASVYYGIKPKEIGFGFYFIFPVFFTNVTNIWQLNKTSRNVVNFGGIYFQLVINIVLICLMYVGVSKPIIFPLILINLTSIVGSLNPFFKYDGYWILSDYFGISNLKLKSRQIISKCFSAFPNSILKTFVEESKVLLAYSFFNIIFWIYIYYRLSLYVYTNVNQLYLNFPNSGWIKNQTSIIETLTSFLLTSVIVYLVGIQAVNNYKLFKK